MAAILQIALKEQIRWMPHSMLRLSLGDACCLPFAHATNGRRLGAQVLSFAGWFQFGSCRYGRCGGGGWRRQVQFCVDAMSGDGTQRPRSLTSLNVVRVQSILGFAESPASNLH